MGGLDAGGIPAGEARGVEMTYGYNEASGPSMTVRYKVIALRRIVRAMQARMSTKYTTTADYMKARGE